MYAWCLAWNALYLTCLGTSSCFVCCAAVAELAWDMMQRGVLLCFIDIVFRSFCLNFVGKCCMMDPLFRNSANAQGCAKQLYSEGGQEAAQLVCRDVVVMLVVKHLMSLPTYLLTTGNQRSSPGPQS